MAFFGVLLGAFGAHAIKDMVTPAMLETYKTGVQYHQIHALAILFVALLAFWIPIRLLRLSGWLFAAGIIVFSGSLYLYALTGIKTFALITPLGGLGFLSGWLCVLFSVTTYKKDPATTPDTP